MSTGLEIVQQLEDHLNVGDTDASSDPTRDLLIKFINRAMRKVALVLTPRNLKSGPIDAATVAGSNTATRPTSLLKVKDVYSKDAGDYKHLEPKPINASINPIDLFDTNSIGSASYWEERGSLIYFDKYFAQSASDGLKVYGILAPTAIDGDNLSPDIDFPEEYDDLIVFRAAVYYFLSDFDTRNVNTNRTLVNEEEARIRTFLGGEIRESMTLDRRFWNHRRL